MKYLLLGFLLLPVISKEPPPSLDAARTEIKDQEKHLQTAIWSYQKGDRQIDLIGVVHIGDKRYYEELNTIFTGYDAVFFEMTGSQAAIKALQAKKTAPPAKEHHGLNQIYALYQSLMALSLQVDVVDYSRQNFIHADMTAQEFTKAQKARGEKITDALLTADIDFSKVDQDLILRAMLTGESDLLKNELMSLMALADDGLSDNKSTLIAGRNQKCLQIVEKNLLQNNQIQKSAIFYGAAHLPDFHRRLSTKGWKRSKSQWLNAWTIPEITEKE